jgi:hypothetical protein
LTRLQQELRAEQLTEARLELRLAELETPSHLAGLGTSAGVASARAGTAGGAP